MKRLNERETLDLLTNVEWKTKVKVMDQLTETFSPTPTGKYWMAVECDAPASLTIADGIDEIIHQAWELVELTQLSDGDHHNPTQRVSSYRFKFIGFPQFNTMEYNDEILLMHAGPWNNYFTNMLNSDVTFLRKIGALAGLERVKVMILPGTETYELVIIEPRDINVNPRQEKEKSGVLDALATSPEKVLRHMAGQCLNDSEWQDAEDICNKLIELSSTDNNAYFMRGYARGCRELYKEAEQDLTRSIELLPTAEAYFYRGNYRDELGRVKQAIDDYSAAIQLDSTQARYFHNRGFCYNKELRFGQAIQDYSEAIRIMPDYVSAWFGRGGAYFNSGNPQRAAQDFARLQELQPQYPPLMALLLQLQKLNGQ